MNMNKILIAGLLVAVCFPETEAQVCGNGGFYVGVNAGIALTRMKYRNDVKKQENVIDAAKLTDKKVYTVKDVDDETNLKKGATYYSCGDADVRAVATVEGSNVKKNKTKAVVELGMGWDTRVNDVMLGVDVNFGLKLGKTKKTVTGMAFLNGYPTTPLEVEGNNTFTLDGTPVEGDSEPDYVVPTDGVYNSGTDVTLKMKNKWNISIMPRVGYLVTPSCELFLTAGVMFTKNKYTISVNGDEAFSKKKTKVVPVFGGGVRYEISDSLYTKIEYNFEGKAKLNKTIDGITHKFKNSAHVIKLGLGYRF